MNWAFHKATILNTILTMANKTHPLSRISTKQVWMNRKIKWPQSCRHFSTTEKST